MKELERVGIPTAHITAMTMVATQIGANRVVAGNMIPHPCGDPTISSEADRALRREIIKTSLEALQTDVEGPSVFTPAINFTP